MIEELPGGYKIVFSGPELRKVSHLVALLRMVQPQIAQILEVQLDQVQGCGGCGKD